MIGEVQLTICRSTWLTRMASEYCSLNDADDFDDPSVVGVAVIRYGGRSYRLYVWFNGLFLSVTFFTPTAHWNLAYLSDEIIDELQKAATNGLMTVETEHLHMKLGKLECLKHVRESITSEVVRRWLKRKEI